MFGREGKPADHAEVEHLHDGPGLAAHDVFRLQVAVNDAVFVAVVQCGRRVADDRGRIADRQAAVDVEQRPQRVAFDQLQHQKRRIVSEIEFVQRAQKRMIQVRRNLRFALESLPLVRVAAALVQQFQCNAAIGVLAIDAFADAAVTAGAEPTDVAKPRRQHRRPVVIIVQRRRQRRRVGSRGVGVGFPQQHALFQIEEFPDRRGVRREVRGVVGRRRFVAGFGPQQAMQGNEIEQDVRFVVQLGQRGDEIAHAWAEARIPGGLQELAEPRAPTVGQFAGPTAQPGLVVGRQAHFLAPGLASGRSISTSVPTKIGRCCLALGRSFVIALRRSLT